jgi:uncharacterized paraquat-inducible protein A
MAHVHTAAIIERTKTQSACKSGKMLMTKKVSKATKEAPPKYHTACPRCDARIDSPGSISDYIDLCRACGNVVKFVVRMEQ